MQRETLESLSKQELIARVLQLSDKEDVSAMLLFEIEREIKPLPRVAKIQLIQDIAEMLKNDSDDLTRYFEPNQEVGYFGPINEPEIAAQLQEMLAS